MFHKILVALDRTDGSAIEVLKTALDLAKATGAQLRLMNVLLPLDAGYPDPIYLAGDGFYGSISTDVFRQHLADWRQTQKHNEDWLQALVNQATADGIGADYEQRYGDPSRTLCESASNWQADLVVIGRRGRRGLSEFLLGSVSNYVMHHAPCSVLTVQGSPETPAPVPTEVAADAATDRPVNADSPEVMA